MQGPPLAPTVMWRVRYASDGAADEVPQDAIRPLRRYEVVITEMATSFEAPAKPDEPTPVIRDVSWVGEATDEDSAKLAAREAWTEKYGPDSPTRGGEKVQVRSLPPQPNSR